MSIALGILLMVSMITANLLLSEPENNPATQLQQSITPIPETQAAFKLSINWWHKVNRYDLGLSQYQHLPNLNLAAAARHLLVPFQNGHIKAFRLQDGGWEWTQDTPYSISSGIHLHQDTAFIGGEDGQISQFDAFNGRLKREFQVSNAVMALATQAAELYVYTIDGELTAFNIPSGQRLWQVNQNEPTSSLFGSSQPQIIDELVIIGSGNGQISAYNRKDGNLVWQRLVGQVRGFSDIESLIDVDADLLEYNQSLIAAPFGGPIQSFSKASQTELWQYPASISHQLLLSQDNQLIVQTNQGQLLSLNPETGAVIWQNETLQLRQLSQLKSIRYQQKNLLLTTDQWANYFILDSQTGTLLYHYQGEYPLALPMLTTQQGLYALNQQGELFSYNLKAD